MPDLLGRLTQALADRYAVEREIGRGGMATVFLAEDLRHHRKVAIKVLHPELAAAVGPERFLREIEAVAGLTHPHVLPLFDSGESEGLLFFVMPYVEGESLRERLEREGQLPVEEAVRIAQDVAEALDHAHRHGLVHRDIKPGNILLEEGHAVVTDFGVARALSEAGEEKVTATGMSVGTPAYMSPEQASGGEVDARSDLYALGCVLYEMLAGEPPLVGATSQSTAAKRLTDRPTPLPALRTRVPPALDRAVQKALERSPADRYATAPELARALEEISSEPVARPAGRRVWAGLAGVVVIGALAVAGWLALRSPEAAPAVEQNSIAVLPFVNMSDDPGNEYFSDGISEELLNLLAKVPELRVTSRSSAFSFKGQNLTIAEIAERLNVAHILEGSVRKAGEEVRITAQLIDARSDTHLWSETWDRTLEDIFLIQDEIAGEVVAQLRITLLGGTPMAAVVDPAAYSMFLQGRYLVRQQSPEGYERGTALLERALALDSAYAPGWTALATAYTGQTDYGLLPQEEGLAMARAAATRALEIDPEYAPAHAALGHVSLSVSDDMDLAASARHYERALELEPADLEILRGAAFLMESLGRQDDAVRIHRYVVARDPVNVYSHYRMGINLLRSGRLQEAMAAFETVRSLSPERIGVQYSIGLTLLRQDRPEAALREIAREPVEGLRLDGLILAHHALGQTAGSDSALEVMIERLASGWSYNIAYGLAFRGEADRAFEWLEKAVGYHDSGLNHIPNQYLFANLFDDPRWLPFLESIGKSPEQLAAIDFEVTLPDL